MGVSVSSSRWANIESISSRLDHARVLEVARDGVTTAIRDSPDFQVRVAIVNRALMYEFGTSIAGWTWTRATGGPIDGFTRFDRGQNVTSSVMQWRQRIQTLSSQFKQRRKETRGADDAEIVSAGLSGLIELSLEWSRRQFVFVLGDHSPVVS